MESPLVYHHHIRSASFPSKSHPMVQKMEQKLNQIQKLEALSTSTSTSTSTSAMHRTSIGLSGLAELYRCVEDALSFPLTKQSLSLRRYDNHVKQLLHLSSNLAEICTKSRKISLTLRQAVENLLSSQLNVSQNDANLFSHYFLVRKEVIRSAKALSLSLCQIYKNLVSKNGELIGMELDQVMRVLRCVSIIHVSVLESLLLALSTPMSKPKLSTITLLISKLVGNNYSYKRKLVLGSDHHQYKKNIPPIDELSNVDVIIQVLSSSTSTTQAVAKEDNIHLGLARQRLEALQVTLKTNENGLNSIFTQLTKIRSSLLSIISF